MDLGRGWVKRTPSCQTCRAEELFIHTDFLLSRARLYKEWKSLYTFLHFEDLEPTNNRAERALRPAVTRRKTAFGSTSEQGLRRTERILSYWQTCRMHGWSFCNYSDCTV